LYLGFIEVLMDMLRKEKSKRSQMSEATSKESLSTVKLEEGRGSPGAQGLGDQLDSNIGLPPLPQKTGKSGSQVESLNSFNNVPGQLPPESRESNAHATTPPPSRGQQYN